VTSSVVSLSTSLSPLVEASNSAANNGGLLGATVVGDRVANGGDGKPGVITQMGVRDEITITRLTAAQATPTVKGMDTTATGIRANAGDNGATAYGSWANASGLNATAVGFRAIAAAGSVAMGFENEARGTQSLAIGYRNIVTGNNSGAIGDPNVVSGNSSYAVGNNNTVAANNTFVLGNNVVVGAGNDNSVVLGNNSTASGPNTVSVGAAGAERRITNVAPGINPTDAVNVSQLNEVGRNAYTGVAMALAMAGQYMPNLLPGESAVGVGVGTYKGYGALSLNFKHLHENGRLSYGAGFSTNGSDVGISAGIGWKW